MRKMDEKLKALLSGEKGRRVFLLLGLCGVLLLALPVFFQGTGKEEQSNRPAQDLSSRGYREELETSLTKLVCAITGETSPTVLVTLENGGRAVYAKDEQSTERDLERTHVLLKSSEGGQEALTETELNPEIKGVVIVSDLAADAVLREELTRAVQTALHISSNRVCVIGSRS